MHIPTIRTIIRRNLLLVFLIALLAGGGGFYLLLERAAMDTAEEEAHMMLSTGMAIRTYTVAHILPNMSARSDHVFHEETVPFFATQAIFHGLSVGKDDYSYREAAVNPTAPNDRAGPFEADLIRQFRDDKHLKEIRGTLDQGNQRLFYLARPISVDDPSCLQCHDTPQRAPAAMLAKYGPFNGFGWKLDDVVGTQVVTVPVTRQFRSTVRLVVILMGGLALIFAVAYFALTISLEAAVVGPLNTLAEVADQASRSTMEKPGMPLSGVHEIRVLAEAIQRLRTSLLKALAQLSQGDDNAR